MIVDFSVEDDRRIPVATQDRLIPTVQIDDFQAHRAQRRFAAFENTLLVGSPMRNRLRNSLGNSLACALTAPCKSRNSAHFALIPRSPNQNLTPNIRFVFKYTTNHPPNTELSPIASLFIATPINCAPAVSPPQINPLITPTFTLCYSP